MFDSAGEGWPITRVLLDIHNYVADGTFSRLQYSDRVTVLSLLLHGYSGAGFWSFYSTISTVISFLISSGRLWSRTNRFGSCRFHSITHHTSPLSSHFRLLTYPYTLYTSHFFVRPILSATPILFLNSSSHPHPIF